MIVIWHLRSAGAYTCRGVLTGRQRWLRLSTGRPSPVAALPCKALPVGPRFPKQELRGSLRAQLLQSIRGRQSVVVTHVVVPCRGSMAAQQRPPAGHAFRERTLLQSAVSVGLVLVFWPTEEAVARLTGR